MVGDYAVVDYGTPNTAKYAENRVEDSSLGYYNATVWQKIYTELTSSTDEIVVGMTSNVANGIGYKLLFYVSVPPTLFHKPTLDVVNASVDPSVSKLRMNTLFTSFFRRHGTGRLVLQPGPILILTWLIQRLRTR